MKKFTQVVCEKRTYSRDILTHDHEYGQLLFPLYGSMHIETPRQALTLQPEHCFFVPPRCSHTFRAMERNEFLIVDIPKHYLFRRADYEALYMDMDAHWRAVRSLLAEEIARTTSASTAALACLGQFIGHSLGRQPFRSIQYIHDHYTSRITVEALAAMEHYHRSYYPTWFKKVTGTTPAAYIRSLRLEEAKRLLRETEWPVTAIGREVGFEHSSSFTRLFVLHEGISPQAYRKSLHSAKEYLDF